MCRRLQAFFKIARLHWSLKVTLFRLSGVAERWHLSRAKLKLHCRSFDMRLLEIFEVGERVSDKRILGGRDK